MDYLDIVLKGATNPNTKHFFTDHIIREYKEAANNGYSENEFFSGCRMVIGWLFDEIERLYDSLLTVLPYVENPEKLEKRKIKIDLQNFTVGSYFGTITGEDVYLMIESFMEAEDKLKGNQIPDPIKPKLTQEQVALICVYNGELVTRDNADLIGAKYGHKKATKLYQLFANYSKRINRTARPDNETLKTLKNKIERFEKILPYINPTKLPMIQEDIKSLKELL